MADDILDLDGKDVYTLAVGYEGMQYPILDIVFRNTPEDCLARALEIAVETEERQKWIKPERNHQQILKQLKDTGQYEDESGEGLFLMMKVLSVNSSAHIRKIKRTKKK